MKAVELEEELVFCLLNRAVSYKKVREAFNALKKNKMVTKKGLKETTEKQISKTLKSTGYRFPNQTARNLKRFSETKINLATASREELCKIKGIGLKLSSLFLNITRKTNYAILDVHIKRWLKEKQILGKNYQESEKNFLEEAKKLCISPSELDYIIWETYR